MDDPAERKETKNGRPRRKERNKKWMTEPKGKKRLNDKTKMKEMNHGRPSRKESNEKWMT